MEIFISQCDLKYHLSLLPSQHFFAATGCLGGGGGCYSAAGSADVEVGSMRDTLLDMDPVGGLLGSLHLLQQNISNSCGSSHHQRSQQHSFEKAPYGSGDYSSLPPLSTSSGPRHHHQRTQSNPSVLQSRYGSLWVVMDMRPGAASSTISSGFGLLQRHHRHGVVFWYQCICAGLCSAVSHIQ